MAIDADDLSRRFTFRLFADGHGEGRAPDGVTYERFRTWKESLRDSRVTARAVPVDQSISFTWPVWR